MTARRVTIADVARAAGVSVGAVSFALNDRPGVGADTRQRILDTAKELQWKPSVRARSLSNSRAFALGLVIARKPELLGTDPFFPAFIAGVETVLADIGMSLLLNVVPDVAAETATYRRLGGEGRVDGVFLTDLRQADPRVALVQELQLPAVTLGKPDLDSPFPAVQVDDGAGVAKLVELLVSKGHRHIAHVTGPLHMLHAASRRDAWRAAMKAAKLPVSAVVTADFSAAGGAAATEKLLARATPPTAIVYGNDVMAIAGAAVAQQRGLRIPADLSITGFDDIELASHVNPALTTIRTDAYRWGQQAAKVLLESIDGAPASNTELPALPLIERQSVTNAPTTHAR